MEKFYRKIELYKRIRSMTDDEFNDFINDKTAKVMARVIKTAFKNISRLKSCFDDARYIQISVVVGASIRTLVILEYLPSNVIFDVIDGVMNKFNFTCVIEINLRDYENYKECPFVICKYENGELVAKSNSSTSMVLQV